MLPLTSDLAFIRAEIQRTMLTTVTINSVVYTYDDYGQRTKVSTLVATSKAQLAQPNGNERRILSQFLVEGVENQEGIKLILPYGTSIDVQYEVVDANSKTWNVVWTNNSQTTTAATVALMTRETYHE